MKVSNRALKLPESPIRKLAPYAVAAKNEGVNVYHLNIGQPDVITPEIMMNALKKFDEKVVAYGPSQGLPEYITALQKYYKKHNIDLSEKDILVTTGGSESIVMAFTVCFNPGDEVIVPEPFYTNYNGFAAQTDVIIKPITTTFENDWALPDSSEFEKIITDKTKAILLCNPSNPTGKVYDKTALKKLVDLCIKHDLFLLSDEVYREFIFDGSKHTSVLEFEEAKNHAVVMDSISKRYSACGARIGAFVTKNESLLNAALRYAQARLCPPTLEQVLAIPSSELGDDYFSGLVLEYKNRRDIIIEELSKMEGVKFKTPNGAFYIIIDLPVDNAEKFITWMLTDFRLNNETVMLSPAEGFYSTPGLGKTQARIAYVLNEEKTRASMKILAAGIKAYNSK